MKKIILTILVLGVMIGVVSAAHSATIGISPSAWLQQSTNYGFNFTVTNDGPASIKEVFIHRPAGFSNLFCKSSPTNWTIGTNTSSICSYIHNTFLVSGSSEIFAVQVDTSSSYGNHTWTITTKDTIVETDDNLIDSEVKTIQSEIYSASSGATINVPAGTYDSETFPITVNQSVTIQAGGSVNGTILNASLSNHSVFNITADGVTIDGFTIVGGGNSSNYEHVIDINANNATIQDNIIIGYNGNTAGVHIAYGKGYSHLIKGNTFRHKNAGEGWGIFAENLTSSTIEDNLCYGDSPWTVNTIEGAPGTCMIIHDADGATIKDNIAYNVKYSWLTFVAKYPRKDTNGVMYEDARDSNITNVVVRDNTVYNINKSGSKAINFKPGAQGGQPGGWTDHANLTIGANVSVGPNNNFHDNSNGIIIDEDDIESGGTGYIHILENITIYNNIFDDNNEYGVLNEQDETINATYNWWGHTTGPYNETTNPSGQGDNVSANVVYDPWWYDSTGSADTTNPGASFANTPYFSLALANITINATATDGRDINNYTIDFGDGSNTTVNVTGEHNVSINISIVHNYTTEDEYTITLTVMDSSGNSVTKTAAIVVNSVEPDWIISLSADEANLISIPFVPNFTSYSTNLDSTYYKHVLGGIVEELDRVWAYTFNETTKTNSWKYRKTTAGGSWSTAAGQDLDYIVPGYGYILFMRNDGILYGSAKTASGDSDTEPVIPSEVHLANGYNLIGVFGNESNFINETLSSLEFGGNAYWNKVYDINGVEITGNLTTEKGYWLSMLHLPPTATVDYYTYYP